MDEENLRASDADREKVVERLRRAVGEGRLSVHEFDERIQATYAARTHKDIAPILADLPAPQPPPAPAPARAPVPRWIPVMWTPWVAVNLLCLAIWLATGTGYFWPFWVAVPWGCALLIPTAIGLLNNEKRGPGPDQPDPGITN